MQTIVHRTMIVAGLTGVMAAMTFDPANSAVTLPTRAVFVIDL